MRAVGARAVVATAAFLVLALAVVGLPESSSPADANPQSVAVRWGPYDVAPGGTENQFFTLNAEKPCTDCYVTGITPNLVYEDGSRARFP